MSECITLAHGAGGKTAELIDTVLRLIFQSTIYR